MNMNILSNAICRCATGGASNEAFRRHAEWLVEWSAKCKKTPMRRRYLKKVLPNVIGNWAGDYGRRCFDVESDPTFQRAYRRIEQMILA